MPDVSFRLVPAALAATVAGWTGWALPFYPAGWFVGLGLLAAAAAAFRPRLGLAFALAVPLLPLGNLALAAALLWAAFGLVLLVVSWSEPRTGLLFALGPLLAPISALGFLPLAALSIRAPARRAVQVAAAVLGAGLVAGVRADAIPFDPEASVLDAATALWRALLDQPELAVLALVLPAAAVALPYARARGPWAIAAYGAAVLAAALLVVPSALAAPLVVAVWATCVAVAVR